MALRIPVSGLWHITGEIDTGKSSFAIGASTEPGKIAVIDGDVKGTSMARSLHEQGFPFGMYLDWHRATRGMRELQMYNYGRELVKNLPENKYEVIVWDNYREMEMSFHAEVTRDPKKYRDEWAPKGDIKGGQEWQSAAALETEFLQELLDKTKQVFLVTHLKSANIGGKQIPGKFVPACQEPLITKTLCRLWLRRNPDGRRVPIALTLKGLNITRYVEGKGAVPINILPQRITPRQEDETLWDTLEYYFANPWRNKPLTGSDRLTEEEISVLSNTLTKDQMAAVRLLQIESELEAAEAQAVLTGRSSQPNRSDDEIKIEIATMISEGKTNDEIRASIADASLPMILMVRKEVK